MDEPTTSGSKTDRTIGVRTDLQNDYIGSKTPNHVEVVKTKLMNGTTANAE